MLNILIVGFGNIGYRHYQGLKKSIQNFKIYVYDYDFKQYNKIDNDIDTTCLKSIKNAPNDIFLLISATSSRNRLKHLKIIMKTKNVKYVILEKMTFQKEPDYISYQKIITQSKTKTYINCARRNWLSYLELKNDIKSDEISSFSLVGGNWNMASNTIHYLDLLLYLTSEKLAKIHLQTDFNDEIIDAKRPGYIEVYGVIFGYLNDIKFEILSKKSTVEKIIRIELKSGKVITLNEAKEEILYEQFGTSKSEKFNTYFQSEITYLYLEDLILKNECLLPNFDENSKIQIEIINQIKRHQDLFIKGEELCLIT